jgi:hypothetical protein
MQQESLFDLRIATIAPDETPPADAHLVRIIDPHPLVIRDHAGHGWFHKPCWVTYTIPVPKSLDAHIEETFRRPAKQKVRKLLRDVPKKYRLLVEDGDAHIPQFHELYRATVVAKPRGVDRVAEHEGGFADGWLGFYLFEGDRMVAGILVKRMLRHLSVAYGAFDPVARRGLDVEHFLLMQVIQKSAERRAKFMSLGVDTNRYGHHLSLHLPSYKLRLGYSPMPYDPGGTELMKIQSFAPFPDGLFFYAFENGRLEAHFFARGEPDVKPFEHATTPPIHVHKIE